MESISYIIIEKNKEIGWFCKEDVIFFLHFGISNLTVRHVQTVIYKRSGMRKEKSW